jgi:hypothetical protein
MPKFLPKQDVIAAFDSAKQTARPFVCKFEKQDGEIRSMTCLAQIPSEFVKGTGDAEKPDADDVRRVLSLDRFAEGIEDGLQRERAGRAAIRSVRMDSVIRIEAL